MHHPPGIALRNVGPPTLAGMDIVAEKTVLYTHDPQNRGQYVELLALDGVSLNVDSGNGFMTLSTRLVIDGVDYLPVQSGIEITKVDGGVSLVTTLVVVAK